MHETGTAEKTKKTYMGHFASEIDVRINAIKHRTTRPRTDCDRAYLTWHHWSSDVDFVCTTNTARDGPPKDSGRERNREHAGRSPSGIKRWKQKENKVRIIHHVIEKTLKASGLPAYRKGGGGAS